MLMPLLVLAQPPASVVPYPHPLITEILYAVPTGEGGDANGDGTRQVAGDEFIELVNPHDRAINLRGYALSDRNPENKGKLRFTFPSLEVPPGGVVVVFNGHESAIPGPVGDGASPPPALNDRFHGAAVFTMRVPSSRTSFSNGGDYVLLSAPDGRPVHCVKWGSFEEKVPEGTALIEEAPKVTGRSVTRLTADGRFAPHPASQGLFSPGLFPFAPPR